MGLGGGGRAAGAGRWGHARGGSIFSFSFLFNLSLPLPPPIGHASQKKGPLCRHLCHLLPGTPAPTGHGLAAARRRGRGHPRRRRRAPRGWGRVCGRGRGGRAGRAAVPAHLPHAARGWRAAGGGLADGGRDQGGRLSAVPMGLRAVSFATRLTPTPHPSSSSLLLRTCARALSLAPSCIMCSLVVPTRVLQHAPPPSLAHSLSLSLSERKQWGKSKGGFLWRSFRYQTARRMNPRHSHHHRRRPSSASHTPCPPNRRRRACLRRHTKGRARHHRRSRRRLPPHHQRTRTRPRVQPAPGRPP